MIAWQHGELSNGLCIINKPKFNANQKPEKPIGFSNLIAEDSGDLLTLLSNT